MQRALRKGDPVELRPETSNCEEAGSHQQVRGRSLCLTGLLALIVWQLFLFRMPWPETYPFKASSGMSEQDKFVYFLYYTNTFPIASTKNGLNYEFYYTRAAVRREPNTLEYSAAAAQRVLRDEGRTLVMEWGHSLRAGQRLSTY